MYDIYQFPSDQQNPWARDDLNLVSDFSARDDVIADIKNLRPNILFDLGCGEGFIARRSEGFWGEYHGFDNSSDQIAQARIKASGNSKFYLMDMNESDQLHENMLVIKDGSKNCCALGIFSISYLTVDAAKKLIQTVWDIQTEGDTGIFTLPHPSVTGLNHSQNNLFKWSAVNYFDSDHFVHGQMAGIDDTRVNVGCFHKTFENIFEIFKPVIGSDLFHFQELKMRRDFCPKKFEPLLGLPLHIKVTWRK